MHLITDSAAFAELCATLASQPYITVDTEFMRETTYWPQLCLLQIGWPDGAVAVDPLAPGIDLSPFDAILANEAVVKVFHAGRQDIEIFFNRTGRVPLPVFDSQVAAMVCGFGDSVSYETLAGKLAGARLDKGSRYSDWSLRPLSERQLAYALDDVIHLRVIYEKLAARLEKTGRSQWVAEEMAVLTSPSTYLIDPQEAWRRLKLRTDKPKVLAILKAAAAWREHEARAKNQPRGRILKDETLIDLALQGPRDIHELSRLRGVSANFAEGPRGAALLQRIAETLAHPGTWPTPDMRDDLPPGLSPVIEMLKMLLKICADEHDVATRLLATSAEIDQIAADDQAPARALSGWRRDVFGEKALKLKHGALWLGVENRRIVMAEQQTRKASDLR